MVAVKATYYKEIQFSSSLFCKNSLLYLTWLNLNSRGKPNLLDMGSLMIKPIQRVMKYPLLLCELLNTTPRSHPDHKALQDALVAVKDMNMNINEFKRRKDIGKKKSLIWDICKDWLV